MSRHHYGTGRRVRVCASSLSGPASTDEFTIVRSYDVPGRETMYSLRGIRESESRLVPESELRRAADPSLADPILH